MKGIPKNIKRIRHIIYFIALVLLDQLTKYAARQNLSGGKTVDIIKDVLVLTLHKNDGAVWGILSGRVSFLAVFTTIILIMILLIYFRIPDTKRYRPLLMIIVFIISGAIGNLIDRVLFRSVTDFIYFKIIDFPVFNVADCYVTLSAIVLLLVTIFYYKDDEMTFLTIRRKKFNFKAENSTSDESTSNAETEKNNKEIEQEKDTNIVK